MTLALLLKYAREGIIVILAAISVLSMRSCVKAGQEVAVVEDRLLRETGARYADRKACAEISGLLTRKVEAGIMWREARERIAAAEAAAHAEAIAETQRLRELYANETANVAAAIAAAQTCEAKVVAQARAVVEVLNESP